MGKILASLIKRYSERPQWFLIAATRLLQQSEPTDKNISEIVLLCQQKAYEKFPIGWYTDLNDGMRPNIRHFLTMTDVSNRDFNYLNNKQKHNWNIDLQGKDIEFASWYHLFDGDRSNDYYLILAEKRAVLEAA
jgi:hypothetical protein